MKEANQAQYFISNPSRGTTATTTFSKIRIDEQTLQVYGADFSFASTVGFVPHHCQGGGCLEKKTWIPYAVARDCTGGNSQLGHAIINLRGTGLALSRGVKFVTAGWIPAGRVTRSDDDQQLDIYGGGYCGWTRPSLSGITESGWSLCLCLKGDCAAEDACVPKDSTRGVVTHNEESGSVPTGDPCQLGVTWESSPPTPEGPRVCKAVQECEPGVTRETAAPTLKADRKCEPCRRCLEGQTQIGTCDKDADYTCRDGCTACLASEWQRVPCNDQNDTVCASCDKCDPKTHFTISDCRLKSNTVCALATECSKAQYEASSLTLSADRQCRPLTVCQPGVEYEEVAATATSDRKCHRYKNCHPGEYVFAEGTATTDRQCKPCTNGFSTVPNSERCTPFRACQPGTYPAKAEESLLADRECTACEVGSTFSTDGVSPCGPVATCLEGETYEIAKPTASTNRRCKACDKCDGVDNHASAPCTLTSNTVCSKCPKCDAGSYAATDCTSSSPTKCAACAQCDLRRQYEDQPCRADADRVCADLRECDPNEVETVAPTETSDRKCAPLDACDAAQYESVAPISLGQGRGSSQRICTEVKTCNLPTMYAAVLPTATSDAVCLPTTKCTSEQFELRAPADGLDRVCQNAKTCKDFEFQSAPHSRGSDAVCTRCHASCARCQGEASDECIACRPGMFMNDGSCTTECPAGMFGSATTGACTPCHESCSSCFGPDSGDCLECKPGLVGSASPHNSDERSVRCDPASDASAAGSGGGTTVGPGGAGATGLSTTSIALIVILVIIIVLAVLAVVVVRRQSRTAPSPDKAVTTSMEGFDNPLYDIGGGVPDQQDSEEFTYSEPASFGIGGTPETHNNGYMDVTAAHEEEA